MDGDSQVDMVGEEGEEGGATQKKKKQTKTRKRRSDFITKEKAALLAPLQTHPRGNLILDSKNKRAGETNFVQGLLQNILQTRDYVLQLDPATKYWDRQPLPQDPSSDIFEENIGDFVDDVIAFEFPSADVLKRSWICPSLKHYDV